MTDGAIMRLVRAMIAPWRRRVFLMVSRGVVKLVDDSMKLQVLQVGLLADEVKSGVGRWQEFGFTSVPKPGSEVLFLSVGGNRNHGAIVAVVDRRYRPTDLEEGEVALYNHEGVHLHIKAGGEVLAGHGATKLVALSNLVFNELEVAKNNTQAAIDYATGIITAIAAGVPVPLDGGAALKTTQVAAMPPAPTLTSPGSVAAEKVKAL